MDTDHNTTQMGRGWQDRRDSKEDLTASPIPGASPPASPAGSSADHALEIPQAARLPDSLLDKKSESGTGFKYDDKASRFPILRSIMPLGSLSHAHGF